MIKYDRKWFKMSKLWHFKVLATERKVRGSNPLWRTTGKSGEPLKYCSL